MKRDRKQSFSAKNLLWELHLRIEAKERRRISRAAMASRLGVSSRTYMEYLRSDHSPLAMLVMIDLLCMVEDEDVIRTVQHWRKERAASLNRLDRTSTT